MSCSSRGLDCWCGIKHDYSFVVMSLRSRLNNHHGRRSPRQNMHRAAAFLKKSGVIPESYLLCHKSSRILSTMTKEDLG